MSRFVALFKEIGPRAEDNPRFQWIRGLSDWYTPPGSSPEVVQQHMEKAMATYAHGAELARAQKGMVTDPLDPSWGEPENLMSLAWCSLNKTTPGSAAGGGVRPAGAGPGARLALRARHPPATDPERPGVALKQSNARARAPAV